MAAFLTELLQCLLIWRGLQLIDDGIKERTAIRERQRLADDRRHAAFMADLEEQRRADKQRHDAFMADLEQRRQANEQRHAEATSALETPIARTAPERKGA